MNQLLLWPDLLAEDESRLLLPGACRYASGTFFEEATLALFGGQRLKISSTVDICPDVRAPDGCYLESKAIGRGGAVIIYSARLEKYRELVQLGESVKFVLWKHEYKLNHPETIESLRDGMAPTVTHVCVIPFSAMDEFLQAVGEEKINGALESRPARGRGASRGWGVGSYCMGYRRRWSRMMTQSNARSVVRLSVFGREVLVGKYRLDGWQSGRWVA